MSKQNGRKDKLKILCNYRIDVQEKTKNWMRQLKSFAERKNKKRESSILRNRSRLRKKLLSKRY